MSSFNKDLDAVYAMIAEGRSFTQAQELAGVLMNSTHKKMSHISQWL